MKNFPKYFFTFFLLLIFSYSKPTSVSFKDTGVRDVMSLLSKKMNKNIIVHIDVTAKITVVLEKVEPQNILDLICRSHKLNWVEDSGVILIYNRENFLTEGKSKTLEPKHIVVNYQVITTGIDSHIFNAYPQIPTHKHKYTL